MNNASLWRAKLDGNKARDRDAVGILRRQGWRVLVLWECQLNDLTKTTARVKAFLGPKNARKRP